jgi:hypothetical protein
MAGLVHVLAAATPTTTSRPGSSVRRTFRASGGVGGTGSVGALPRPLLLLVLVLVLLCLPATVVAAIFAENIEVAEAHGYRITEHQNASLFFECFPYVCPEPVWEK